LPPFRDSVYGNELLQVTLSKELASTLLVKTDAVPKLRAAALSVQFDTTVAVAVKVVEVLPVPLFGHAFVVLLR
jgi:predicted NAD/FAD-dependent oxidoreductase